MSQQQRVNMTKDQLLEASKVSSVDAYAITAICLFSTGHWIGGSIALGVAVFQLICYAAATQSK